MQGYVHIFFCLALFLTNISLHFVIQSDDASKRIDKVSMYSMENHKGDTVGVRVFVQTTSNWPDKGCLAMVGTLSGACLASRQSIQANLIKYLECDKHQSEYCSYISSNVLSGLATFKNGNWTGKNMSDLQDLLPDIIQRAGDFFHNSFVATEKSATAIYRSVLFSLVQAVLLSNVLVHVLTEITAFQGPTVAIFGRMFLMFAPILIGLSYAFTDSGVWSILSAILVPAIITLVWYEACLPHTQKSWIHPFYFTVALSCLTLLSLTENGVRDNATVFPELLKAQSISQIFMGAVWYFSIDKAAREKSLRFNFGTVTIIVIAVLFPFISAFAPYGYSQDLSPSTSALFWPAIISVIGLFTAMWVQDVDVLDAACSARTPQQQRWQHFSSGRLYSSAMMVLFGLFLALYYLSEHIKTYRVTRDGWPEISTHFDPTLPNSIQGSNI